MITTGTATVIAAGIAGAAKLGEGILGSRATSRATKASRAATAEALAFEREREAQRRKEHEEALAMEKAQWEARESRRAEILARYGRSYSPRPWSPGIGSKTRSQPTGQPTTSSQGQSPTTLGRIGGASYEPLTPPLTPPRMTFGRMNEWPRYGG